MLRLLALLLSMAIVTGCGQRITVVKAKQDRFASQGSDREKRSSPPNPAYDSYFNDALIVFRQGDYERATTLFGQAISINAESWQAHYYLGLAHCKKQEHDLAQSSFNSCLTCAPDDNRTRSRIYLAMAECWEKQGKLGQAELNYITALNLYPDSSPATAGLERIEQLRRQSRR